MRYVAAQVGVGQYAAVNLAQEALQQARDRFASGVSNSLEVVQAQQASTLANENYIASLNAHNLAKLLLARSLGVAERQVREVEREGIDSGWPPL